MNQEQRVLLHLSLIDGIGPSVIQKIIHTRSAHHVWADLYSLTISDWIHTFGLSDVTAQKVVTGLRDTTLLEKECALIERHTIQVSTALDDSYPELLKHIHLPPTVLYSRGASLAGKQKKLAIVGARKANQYGQQFINRMVPALVAHDVTIVSGGALGIDSMAHQATIDAGGKTVVVLGSGLLNPAPRSHKKLFSAVVENGGTLVSAFPLQTDPHPHNFPIRNRIIAGMSNGTIVVQAAKKSGSLITAQHALEQGRDVFAVPGPFDDPLNEGCHRLIQDGAKLIMNAHDVLVEYGITAPEQASLFNTPAQKTEPKYAPDSIEAQLIQACTRAQSIDTLAAQTKRSLSELQTVLFTLQLEGVIKQDFTGMWKSC